VLDLFLLVAIPATFLLVPAVGVALFETLLNGGF
jgi:hypothetical protein